MTRNGHPSWEEILDAVESPRRASPFIRDHLRTCDHCRTVADEARRVLQSLSAARLPHPPRALVEQTLAALSQRLQEREAAAARPFQGDVREIIARLQAGWRGVAAALIADSWRASPALRGAAEASSRVLIFETEGYSIAISVSNVAGASGRHLIGQVVPRQGTALPPAGWALARQAPDVVAERLTDLGEFQLTGLAPETTELDLVLGEEHVSVNLPPG